MRKELGIIVEAFPGRLKLIAVSNATNIREIPMDNY
jgi:hypothetical protein